eukprot:14736150-Alexandrium_andersonii.AAC.1
MDLHRNVLGRAAGSSRVRRHGASEHRPEPVPPEPRQRGGEGGSPTPGLSHALLDGPAAVSYTHLTLPTICSV